MKKTEHWYLGIVKRLTLAIRRSLFPVNVKWLREFYKGYDGIVDLIDYIVRCESQRKRLHSIGSSTIDLDGVLDDETLTDKEAAYAIFFKTYKLHIGSPDGSVTPFEWLEKFSNIFAKLPSSERDTFNVVCRDFAKISNAPSKIVTFKGNSEIVVN